MNTRSSSLSLALRSIFPVYLLTNCRQSRWSLGSPQPPFGLPRFAVLVEPVVMDREEGNRMPLFLLISSSNLVMVCWLLQSFPLWCRPLTGINPTWDLVQLHSTSSWTQSICDEQSLDSHKDSLLVYRPQSLNALGGFCSRNINKMLKYTYLRRSYIQRILGGGGGGGGVLITFLVGVVPPGPENPYPIHRPKYTIFHTLFQT